MVKWSNTWLNKKDNNGTLIRLWASKKDETYASCNVCSCELKFSTLGFHALLLHSTKPKHKAKADVRFSSLMQHFTAQGSTSSTSNQRASSSTATTGTRTLVLDLSLNDKGQLQKPRGCLKLRSVIYHLEMQIKPLKCSRECFLTVLLLIPSP